jgi:hypothetical protein
MASNQKFLTFGQLLPKDAGAGPHPRPAAVDPRAHSTEDTYLRALGARGGGWKDSFYIGDDKSDLVGFMEGDVDVLIGSSEIGTGVDGLQRVLNHWFRRGASRPREFHASAAA